MAPQQPAWARPFDRLDLTGADTTGVYLGNEGREAAVRAARARGISGRHVIPAAAGPWGGLYVFLFGRGEARNSVMLAAEDPAAPLVEVRLDAGSFSYRDPIPTGHLVSITESVERDYPPSSFPGAMTTAATDLVRARRGLDGKDVFVFGGAKRMRMDEVQRLVLDPLLPFLSDFPPGSTSERQGGLRLLSERAAPSGPLTTDVMYLARVLSLALCLIDEALEAGASGVLVRDLDDEITDALTGAWELKTFSRQERFERLG